jgi:biopolymer transport protein ExbD
MRTALTVTCLLAFAQIAQIAMGQSAPSNGDADVLTIRISADGVCHFLDTSTPCDELGNYLLSKHLAQNGHVHIAVDRTSKYELVAAALGSLDRAGFKVGFVNKDVLAPIVQIRISSSQNTCFIADLGVQCRDVGATLLGMNVAADADIHIIGDRDVGYEMLRTVMDSLIQAGYKLKVGVVTTDE